MTDKELMVNDFVLWDGKVARVETIWLNSHAVKLVIGKDKVFRDAFLTDVTPIPITPEILGKNGFEYNEEKYLLTCWVGNSFIDYDGNTRYFMIVNKGRTYEGEIQYVHELQHALRLCKIDKKIEL